jgi:hypothetical protein
VTFEVIFFWHVLNLVLLVKVTDSIGVDRPCNVVFITKERRDYCSATFSVVNKCMFHLPVLRL